MEWWIHFFNQFLAIAFVVCYSYQLFYAFLAFLPERRPKNAKKQHRYAIIIPARNEEDVIGDLIDSIEKQDYPSGLLDVFVIADNCTDHTAQVARSLGAKVYERFNTEEVGKGYAMDFVLKKIWKDYGEHYFEGFLVFDADNLLDSSYLTEINKVYDNGYRVVTSYRNSKNFDSNWISAGYSMWFLREAALLNSARMRMGTSCAISGTGFLVSNDLLLNQGGWKFHLLTEDLEFTADSVIHGEKIGYCPTAIFYDEQPTDFVQSWNQRLRWMKGGYQVLGKYGGALAKTTLKERSMSCLDILMTLSPAMIITVAGVMVNAGFCLAGFLYPVQCAAIVRTTLLAVGNMLLGFGEMMILLGFITLVTQWKRIHCSIPKRILYLLTFPVYVLTNMPIALVALFKKIEWKPIKHTVRKSIKELHQEIL